MSIINTYVTTLKPKKSRNNKQHTQIDKLEIIAGDFNI